MPKRTKSKSLLPDFFVATICLVIAAFFLFLFWRDLNTSTLRSDKKKIGTITSKYKVVQRKFDDRVVWERVSQDTDLYYADTIRTADFAQLRIKFNNGTQLDVYENTMIQVYYTEDAGLMINVEGGDIQVDSTEATDAVDVKLGDGSVVSVDAGSSLAARSDAESGVHNVEVKTGSAQIVTETGESATLSLGESVSISAESSLRVNPLTVTSLPKDLRVLSVQDQDAPLRLEWRTAPSQEDEAPEVTVQTSRTRDFSVIESSVTVSGENSTEIQAQDGVLYWRVFTEDSRETPVEGRITVQDVTPVEGISPADQSEFRYRLNAPRINFRWQPSEFAEQYRLTVSSTQDMQTVVRQVQTQDSFALIDTLSSGTYWWRVEPYYSQNGMGYTAGSPVYQFTIIQNETIRPPELSLPSRNARISYRGEASAHFMWKSELPNSVYTFMLSSTEDFSSIIEETQTEALRLFVNFTALSLSDGTYYWKIIRHSDEAEDTEPESEVRSFTLEKQEAQKARLLYPTDGFVSEEASFSGTQFMWRAAEPAAASSLDADRAEPPHISVFQIAPREDFSVLAEERIVQTQTAVSGIRLPSGTYWWRVGSMSDSGEKEAFTEARLFTIVSELAVPEIVSPQVNEELVLLTGSEALVSWRPVSGADSYTVRIADASTGAIVAQKQNLVQESARFALSSGAYEVSVQAQTTATETVPPRFSGTQNRAFSVRAPETITQLLPEDRASFAGLTALREPIRFSWSAGRDEAASYEFILTRVLSNGSTRVVEDTTVRSTSYTMTRLTEGTYRWKIKASTKDGLPIDSAERTFTVSAVPQLPAPTLLEPTQNLVMGPTYLRTNRTITFRWRAVSGATSYSFVLYKRGRNGSLSAVYSERAVQGTQVRLTDLSILDVGDFVWNVTAFSYARDGYEEQRGRAATGTFKIDFTVPDKVETVQPGRLYGE